MMMVNYLVPVDITTCPDFNYRVILFSLECGDVLYCMHIINHQYNIVHVHLTITCRLQSCQMSCKPRLAVCIQLIG